MKQTDGLFRRYLKRLPWVSWYLDRIGAAKIADTPEQFDVVVMPNLYGDVISDTLQPKFQDQSDWQVQPI